MAGAGVGAGGRPGSRAVVVRDRAQGPAPPSPGRIAAVVPAPGRVHHPRRVGAGMSVGLDRDDIRVLLDDLSAELAARGAKADLFLVGGAAIAVAYDQA